MNMSDETKAQTFDGDVAVVRPNVRIREHGTFDEVVKKAKLVRDSTEARHEAYTVRVNKRLALAVEEEVEQALETALYVAFLAQHPTPEPTDEDRDHARAWIVSHGSPEPDEAEVHKYASSRAQTRHHEAFREWCTAVMQVPDLEALDFNHAVRDFLIQYANL